MDAPKGEFFQELDQFVLPCEGELLAALKRVEKARSLLDGKRKEDIRSVSQHHVNYGYRRTRAGAKLAEIHAKSGVLTGCTTVLDLCGGPGAFLLVVWHDHPEAQIWGVTRSDGPGYYKEVISNPRFHPLGGFGGDLLSKDTRMSIFQDCPDVSLLLADGAVDETKDYSDEFGRNERLFRAEVSMLCKLKEGGSFVLKILGYTDPRACLLFCNVATWFVSAQLIKPDHSQPTNSECYWIFRGKQRVRRPINVNNAWAYYNTVLVWSNRQVKALETLYG